MFESSKEGSMALPAIVAFFIVLSIGIMASYRES